MSPAAHTCTLHALSSTFASPVSNGDSASPQQDPDEFLIPASPCSPGSDLTDGLRNSKQTLGIDAGLHCMPDAFRV